MSSCLLLGRKTRLSLKVSELSWKNNKGGKKKGGEKEQARQGEVEIFSERCSQKEDLIWSEDYVGGAHRRFTQVGLYCTTHLSVFPFEF